MKNGYAFALLFFVGLISPTGVHGAPMVYLGESVVFCGDTAEISLYINDATGGTQFGVDVYFGTNCLTYISIRPGAQTQAWSSITAQVISPGNLRILATGGSSAPLLSRSEVARISFRMIEGRCSCGFYPAPSNGSGALAGALYSTGRVYFSDILPPTPSPSPTRTPTPTPTPSPSPTPGAPMDADEDGYADWFEEIVFSDPYASSSRPILGDINGDGLADMKDSILLWRAVRQGEGALAGLNPARADINWDGRIDHSDALALYGWILGRAGYELLPIVY